MVMINLTLTKKILSSNTLHRTTNTRTIEYDVLLRRHVSQQRQLKNQSDTSEIALLMDVRTFLKYF